MNRLLNSAINRLIALLSVLHHQLSRLRYAVFASRAFQRLFAVELEQTARAGAMLFVEQVQKREKAKQVVGKIIDGQFGEKKRFSKRYGN